MRPSTSFHTALTTVALVSFIPFALTLSGCGKHRAASKDIRLWTPAYFYPDGEGAADWDRLIQASGRVPVVAIVNPDSGPGDHRDSTYSDALDRAKDAGVTLLGYVSTRYGHRPIAEVEHDMEAWLAFYPEIDGFHLDEQTSADADVPYYRKLVIFARSQRSDLVVAGNPGDLPSTAYFESGISVESVFEGGSGFASFALPASAARNGRRSFAAEIYGVTSKAQMREDLKSARRKGIGEVFVTDGAMPNPWARLPAYWEDEVAEVEALNNGSISAGDLAQAPGSP